MIIPLTPIVIKGYHSKSGSSPRESKSCIERDLPGILLIKRFFPKDKTI
ncbi:MAG: hypothetical protein ACUZ8E_07920 [Candidatus Anammoxibacter sp.]